MTCEEVEASGRRRIIARAGYEKASRIGYSIGLNYPPDWGEHTASLRQGDRTVLNPDVCFHMILGMWQDDSGVQAERDLPRSRRRHAEIQTASRVVSS